MDRDIQYLADLVGKKSRDLTIHDIKTLHGMSGTVSGLRPGMPRRKCIILAIELAKDIRFVLQIGNQKIKRHISKFSWEPVVKVVKETVRADTKIRCICENYLRQHGEHRRSCPVHVLGMDVSLERLRQDLIKPDDPDEFTE